MQVILPEHALPARLTLNPELRLSDDEYFELCSANPDLRLERTAQGEIIIVPPAGLESDFQCGDVFGQLRQWAKADGRGKAFGSSVEFILPTGAALSPDAAWVSNVGLAQVSKDERRKFPHLSPEFVVEVMSPSDRLPAANQNMQEWQRGGVELGWLIHPDKRTIHIYRSEHHEPEILSGITQLFADGPIAGFVLDLPEIWAGL